LAVVSAGSLAAHQLPLMDRSHQQPAGCHERGKSPEPVPVSYKCCLAGHGSAMLEAIFVLQPTLLPVVRTVLPAHTAAAIVLSFHEPLTLSGSPPGMPPLRI
jgi:hypothetical protein